MLVFEKTIVTAKSEQVGQIMETGGVRCKYK